MQIVFVTTEFVTEPYYAGGLANYLARMTLELARRGHEVHVLTYSEETPREVTYQAVKVHRVGSSPRLELFDRISRYRYPHTVKWLDYSLQVYLRLRRLHKEIHIDFIQYPNYLYPGLVVSQLLKIPYALRLSTYAPLLNKEAGISENRDMVLHLNIEKWHIHHSQFVYAPSQTLASFVQKDIGLKKVDVIRTPFDLELNQDDWDPGIYKTLLAEKKYLLFFGRFQRHKGIQVLADALPTILSANPDLVAVLVGSDSGSKEIPSYKEYIEKSCREYLRQLVMLDSLPHEQLFPIIANARLVVLPSLVDNLPNAMLEAMALRRPVIGTTGASFDEIITEGVSGFLVQPGDPVALTQKINDVWRCSDEKLRIIGDQAQCALAQLSTEITIPLFEKYIRQVIGEKRGIG